VKCLAILLVGLVAVLTACSPAKEVVSEPERIAQWTVEGSVTTEPFTITEEPWLVGWVFTPRTLNFFQIDIRYADGRFYAKPIATLTNYGLGSTDAFYSQDKGTFYLEITAEGGVAEVWVVGHGEVNR